MLTLTRETGKRPCMLCTHDTGTSDAVYYFTDSAASEEMQDATEGVCQACIDAAQGPGRYEAYGGHDEHIATILMLEHWDLIGVGADDWMGGHNGQDYCARFDNYLFIADDRGFRTFEYFDSEEKATQMYDRYFAGGWGADEDDIYVSYERHPVKIWCEGKEIPLHPNANGNISENRIDAAINLWMKDSGFFPNVWDSDGRGVTLRKMKVVSWLT